MVLVAVTKLKLDTSHPDEGKRTETSKTKRTRGIPRKREFLVKDQSLSEGEEAWVTTTSQCIRDSAKQPLLH
jgi:hypothetical protein